MTVNVPWRLSHLVTLYITSVVGLSLVVLSWYGASGSARFNSALAWVNVGVIGLVVAGTGNVLWLLHGHRAVRARQRALVDALTPEAPSTAPAAGDGTVSLAVPGGRRAHLPGCPLIAGKKTVKAARKLPPCEACRP